LAEHLDTRNLPEPLGGRRFHRNAILPRGIFILVPTLATLTAFLAITSNGVARKDCFPVESLPANLRPRAEELLLKALDSEALYTFVGLKPMSSGWVSHRFKVDAPELGALERDREVLRALRSGEDVFATLQPFWRVFDGARFVDGMLYHRDGVARAVRDHARFFAFYGVTPSSHPVEVTMAFEVDATAQRNRGYGYLFGYPDHAVDFFVESEETTRKTKAFVARDFLHIPTFAAEKHQFVYAVPKGHVVNESDIQLKAHALPVLAQYRKLRAKYIGAGKPGVVALLRDWFDDGTGRCSSATALKKIKSRSDL
jgi:hypothetical protein